MSTEEDRARWLGQAVAAAETGQEWTISTDDPKTLAALLHDAVEFIVDHRTRIRNLRGQAPDAALLPYDVLEGVEAVANGAELPETTTPKDIYGLLAYATVQAHWLGAAATMPAYESLPAWLAANREALKPKMIGDNND